MASCGAEQKNTKGGKRTSLKTDLAIQIVLGVLVLCRPAQSILLGKKNIPILYMTKIG